MLGNVFPIGVLYPGRSEEETSTLPLQFLLGQVTGNAAGNRSSTKSQALEEAYGDCISTS